MSYILCEKVRSLEPYEPISGTYNIRLDANESCYQLPESLKADIQKAIENVQFNRYPDPTATELIKAFSNYYKLSPKTVTAGNGSDELISLIIYTMIEDAGTVLTVSPDFSMYGFYATTGGHRVVIADKNDDLTFNVDEVIKKANEENAALIIFSNPCNPTGSGASKEEMRKLITSVNAMVVLDEAYMDFWNESLLDEVEKYDNLIILKTASKAVGSAALRLGFAIANETITKALRSVKAPYNVNSISQAIGTIIYKNTEILENSRKSLIFLTKSLYNGIMALKEKYSVPMTVYPTCTNFVYIKTDLSKEITDFLAENSIAIRLFKDGYIRISTGTEQENKIVLEVLEKFFAKLG